MLEPPHTIITTTAAMVPFQNRDRVCTDCECPASSMPIRGQSLLRDCDRSLLLLPDPFQTPGKVGRLDGKDGDIRSLKWLRTYARTR